MSVEILKSNQQTTDDPRRVLENAVVRLLKRKPFYGHLLFGFRRRLDTSAHALGVTVVNGIPTLCVDVDKYADFSNLEQQALLEHGIKHLLHLHPVRGRGFHHMTWDVAADMALNPDIENMPLDAPRPERYQFADGLAAEEYARLLQKDFDLGNLEGEGIGDAESEQGGDVGEGGGEEQAERSRAAPISPSCATLRPGFGLI